MPGPDGTAQAVWMRLPGQGSGNRIHMSFISLTGAGMTIFIFVMHR